MANRKVQQTSWFVYGARMARNDDRRQRLADAGLAVLAREGARGLTHRALDREAGVPTGTASNYFRTRAELVRALADRIGQRLAPDPDTVAGLRTGEAGPAMFADHVRDIVRRLATDGAQGIQIDHGHRLITPLGPAQKPLRPLIGCLAQAIAHQLGHRHVRQQQRIVQQWHDQTVDTLQRLRHDVLLPYCLDGLL